MKIVFFDPRCLSVYGAQKSMLTLAKGVQERGNEVIVSTTMPGPLASAACEAGLAVKVLSLGGGANRFGGEVFRGGLGRRLSLLRDVATFYREAFRWLRTERPDQVYVNNERAVILLAPPARLLRLPVLYYVRGEKRTKGLCYLCPLLATRVILIARTIRRAFRPWEMALSGRKFSLLYTGFPFGPLLAGNREEIRQKLGWSDVSKVVGVVGAINPRKGQDLFIEAMILLAQKFNLEVVIAGEVSPGSEDFAEDIRKRTRAAGIEKRVHWLGYVDAPEQVFAACDVTVLPSSSEGLPRTIIESLAQGCPVVATDAGAAREVLEKPWLGRIVARDAEGIAGGIAAVLTELPFSPDAASERRQDVMERFPLENYINGFIEIVSAPPRSSVKWAA